MTDTDIALLRIIRDDIGAAIPALRAAAERYVVEEPGDWSPVPGLLRLHHAHGLVSGLIDCETKEAA